MEITQKIVNNYLEKLDSAENKGDLRQLHLIALEILDNLISSENKHLEEKVVLKEGSIKSKLLSLVEHNKN
jgi:hypothetical protein